MPDNHVTASGLHQHGRRDFAGKRALFFPEDILRADGDVAALRGLYRRGNCRERWRDHNVAMPRAARQWHKRREKRARLRLRLEHLPISRDHPPPFRLAHLFSDLSVGPLCSLLCEFPIQLLSLRASTPGSFRPPRNSSEAPPPVDMCEILFATPD